MPTPERSFPIVFRALAAAVAAITIAWLVPVAARAANDPPSKEDVEDARDRKRQLFADVDAMQSELAAIQGRLAEAAELVEQKEELLTETKAELLQTQQRLARTERRYDRIVAQLNERVTDAFMQGPGSSVGFLLGATSISDLSDRIEYVDAVARSDAGLANEAQNLRNVLEADEARLEELERRHAEQLADTEARRDQVASDLQRQQELTAAIEAKADEAAEWADEIAKDYRQFQRELAAQQAAAGGAALPSAWQGVMRTCPVGSPNAFGDGFGAPRYVGGYHPHRGVDIVAAEGTPIYAPFDGYARDATNLYGGTSVIVEGRFGYVYNAHLGSITKLGAVRAGDQIGTVSSTGIAGGSTPHDHFEFHPNVIPSGWPESSYGYSVIDSAINPYPLLVAACR